MKLDEKWVEKTEEWIFRQIEKQLFVHIMDEIFLEMNKRGNQMEMSERRKRMDKQRDRKEVFHSKKWMKNSHVDE